MKQIIEDILIYSGLNAKSLSEKIGLARPQAIYDIINGKTKTISSSMEIKILSAFPEINRAWLLTGEGEMLKSPATQNNRNGDNIQGHSITVNKTEKDYLEIIKQQSSQLSKSQEQIDRLIGLLEKTH